MKTILKLIALFKKIVQTVFELEKCDDCHQKLSTIKCWDGIIAPVGTEVNLCDNCYAKRKEDIQLKLSSTI